MAVVVPGTIPSLPVAFDVQGDDLVLIYQPGQTPSTRAAKVSDVGGVPSTNPVFSGTVTADGVATANVSGTDGLTVNGGSNGVTVAGGPLVIPTIGRLLVGDGATTTAGGSLGHLQFNQINLAGTITDTAATLNNFAVPSDTADASSAPNTPAYLGVNANFGGTGFGGGRAGQRNQITQTGSVNGGSFTAANFWMNGGGFPSPNAQYYSGNFQTQIAANTGSIDLAHGGGEVNIQILSGNTVVAKAMWTLVQESGDAVQGASYDTALGISNQGNCVGWSNGISLGRYDGVWPITTSGTIFGTYVQIADGAAGRDTQFPANKCFAGVDFQKVNFSKASGYAFRAPGWSIDGTGQISTANALIGTTATGIKLDIPNQIVTSAAVSAGGSGYYVGDIVYDSWGGQYEVATVTGTVVTGVTLLVGGVASSAQSNPAATTGGSGTGLTLTLTWSASKNTLSINPSGGATTVGGQLTSTHFQTGGNITNPGTQSASNSWIYNGWGITGTTPVTWSPVYFGITDTVDASAVSGGIFMLRVQDSCGTGHAGGHGCFSGFVNVTQKPANATGPAYACASFLSQVAANLWGTELTYMAANGGPQGANITGALTAAGTNVFSVNGLEVDTNLPSGSSAVAHIGLFVNRLNGSAVRGSQEDAAIQITRGDTATSTWFAGIEMGHFSGSSPFGSDSIYIRSIRRTMPSLDSAPVADTGIDFQDTSFTSFFARSLNYAIDNTGAAFVNGVTTTGTVQAKTATVSSISIGTFGGVTGGWYPIVPTITIQAPPSGGTQATASVATMGLARIPVSNGINTAGSGYSVNDVLTISGATGTAGTLTVTSVDGTGAITGASVTTAGSMSALPANPASVTGGAGTGAKFNFYYKILTITVGNAGAGYAASPPPKVYTSGSNDTNRIVAALTAVMSSSTATLSLNPSGGAIQPGSGAWSANGSVATSLTSLGPTGANTTVQEWFTVKNASGVTRYIPAF